MPNEYSIAHFCHCTKFCWTVQNVTYSESQLIHLLRYPQLIHHHQKFVYPFVKIAMASPISLNGTSSYPVNQHAPPTKINKQTTTTKTGLLLFQLPHLPPDIKFISKCQELYLSNVFSIQLDLINFIAKILINLPLFLPNNIRICIHSSVLFYIPFHTQQQSNLSKI